MRWGDGSRELLWRWTSHINSAHDLRQMYAGARANRVARRYARFWSRVFALGLAPRRWVTLEVRGRRSGRPTRFPLGMADLDGQWYLVSMLGEECNWVRNVRAAGGTARLMHGRARTVRLEEVPVGARVPILRRYLRTVPGGRPHIGLGPDATDAQLRSVAATIPVFRVGRPPAGG